MSEWVVMHQPCARCTSSDGASKNSDGWWTCFSCHERWPDEGGEMLVAEVPRVRPLEMSGDVAPIPDRRISEATCKKFGVTVLYAPGKGTVQEHNYPYFNKKTGELTAAKKRLCDSKEFRWMGDRTDIGMFGQQLLHSNSKFVTIVEGEVDALSFYEMMGDKFPVVSPRDGAKSLVRDVKANLEELEKYKEIVICMDNDEYGSEAFDAVKDLFTPGKVKRVMLPMKDANAMLKAGKVKEFIKCWWDAKLYEPDGVVSIVDTWDAIIKYKNTPSVPWPWQGLNSMTRGIRQSEIVTLISGTGMGKSQLLREIQEHLVATTDWNIGILALEESIARTVMGLMSMKAGRPLHLEEDTPEEELHKYWRLVSQDNRFTLLDHQGVRGIDKIKARVRYMARSRGCKAVMLDHLHIALSSVEGASGDWSKIDELMTDLRSLAHELNIALFVVSHVSRSGGQAHEEGGRLALNNIRGSQGIAQLSDLVVAMERNQQADDETERNTTLLRILKARWTGETGPACHLYYDKSTGRMSEVSGKVLSTGVPSEF